jgi:hypothetical protein
MNFINSSIQSEGLVNTGSFRMVMDVITSSISTYTFNSAQVGAVAVIDGVGGQKVNLGIANTLFVGHEYWIYNDSDFDVEIRNHSNILLNTMERKTRVKCVLLNNTTLSGIWMLLDIESPEIAGRNKLVGLFSSTATSNSNKFLDTENIASSDSLPAVMPSAGSIRLVTFSNTNTNPRGTFQFRKNGIVLFSVVLPGNSKTYSWDVDYPVSKNDRVDCKILNDGSGVSKPLVKIYY